MCTQLKDEYERATTDEKRAEIIDIRIKHDDHVIAERTAYQNARLRARTEPADMTCIIIDGMDQSKTNVPHFVVRDKDNEHLSQLPVHFTGVLIHSPVAEGKIPVIYHDIKHVPHDSNLTIHCLLEALRVIKESLGRTLFLQLDNCARENKNRYVLSFVSLLVQLEIFKEATIHFLPVGHTHEDVDQLFSRISSVLRHRNAFTLNDLAMETANSFSSAVEVVPVKMVQNIKDQLAEHMDGPFKNHSRPLWFRFRKVDSATYMHYKLWESDPWEPATDSEWPKGLTCLKTTPDLQQLVPWVEPSLEKANYEKLCHELPNSYNSRLPQPAREWWADFLANKIKPSYEEVPPMEKWGLSDLLERQVTESPEEDMVALESLRTRVERSCPQVSIGRQGICQRNINIVNDYTSLTVGMLAAVHLDETEGRPFIGKVEEVCAEDILIHWLKGTWTGVWRQWMAKQGRQCVPYTSKLSKSSLILWDFTLTQGRKLKQTTVRELQGKYQELDG